ncbi:SDR family oxidoreductase [Saccharomonospora sp. NPDC046836]|uniref:SDR family NAD(P)-dependent oxidoreductase n=1 Tax=Saccharomonospora sp. NPDC046836 TaxID=3156921 RepID=UPI0033F8D91D
MNQGLAVVTGSRGGIGRHTCQLLAARGWEVLGVDRRREPEDRYTAYRLDLCAPDAEAELFTSILAERGTPRVLVNNAGVFGAVPFLDTGADYLDDVFAVNFAAAFRLTQQFVRALVTEGSPGVVVNVASVTARMGGFDVAYAASKAAVIGMTRSLGPELAPYGIRVNAVAPGHVDTPMLRASDPDEIAKRRTRIPLRRAADPREVAEVIGFLAGDASSYMTGTTVDVNGGVH